MMMMMMIQVNTHGCEASSAGEQLCALKYCYIMHPSRPEHSCTVALGTRTDSDIAALCHIMHPYRLEHSCTVTLGARTGLDIAALCHIMHPYGLEHSYTVTLGAHTGLDIAALPHHAPIQA